MSEKLCALRKIGGGMSEKVLWTNPSPTSNFGTQTISLTESMASYKYLKFRIRPSTTNGQGNEIQIIISVEDFKETIIPAVTQYNTHLTIGGRNGNLEYTRAVWYKSDTEIYIETAYRTSTSNTLQSAVIPLEIIGMR